MSFINTQEKEINCKIAYYGPALAGKTTTIRYIYEQTAPKHRGRLVTLSEEDDKTLLFDFLPLSLGKVKGYTIRFHLYTVPGQVLYDSARKLILKGLDGLVFVADSQIERLQENLESWKNLEKNLKNHDIDFRTLPTALQYNKRDLPNILPAADLRRVFGEGEFLEFETVATQGTQVMECFQAVAKKVLLDLNK